MNPLDQLRSLGYVVDEHQELRDDGSVNRTISIRGWGLAMMLPADELDDAIAGIVDDEAHAERRAQFLASVAPLA